MSCYSSTKQFLAIKAKAMGQKLHTESAKCSKSFHTNCKQQILHICHNKLRLHIKTDTMLENQADTNAQFHSQRSCLVPNSDVMTTPTACNFSHFGGRGHV
jgi:hypothetical protein